MRPPVIRYVFPRLNIGGAEKHAILLASRLRQRGFDAGFLTIFEEGELAESVYQAGTPLECLGEKNPWSVGTMFRIFSWLRHRHVDILHAYLFGFHLFAALPARLLKVPVILSSRRELAHWQRRKHLVVENLGNLFADGVVACSHAVRQWTLEREKIDPRKIHVIHNGVDLVRFHSRGKAAEVRREFGIPENAPLVGTVANFSEEKGYPYFLAACACIAGKFPEARFLIVGSGPYEAQVRSEVGSMPIREKIIFTGSRTDIPELLCALDLFVLASVAEGFPNVLLEAMAVAKPVVATSVGGIPELVDSGRDGVLVPARDSRALAEGVAELLGDPQKAAQMGRRARQKIEERFSIDLMVENYARYYRQWLEKKQVAVEIKEGRGAHETVPVSSAP